MRNMKTQYIVLDYRINLYFYDYKLAIEIYANNHSDRNTVYNTKGKNKKSKNLDVGSLELIPAKKALIKYLDNEICSHIKQ